MREILYYRSWSGRSPVEEFIGSLPEKPRNRVVAALDLIERAETTLPQLFKKLPGTGGLWEVRVRHAGDTFRLLGFLDGPRLVVLVSGFAKKTRKVPVAEISLAQDRRREYERRKGHE
ncbi:MAG TPA: type II toxin-antitoxin system RelE/ParE family toxin [Longimicrobium sp.]